MKYMGSKRRMLEHGLGKIIDNEVSSASRFVDLFSGSGVVAQYVSTHFSVPVVAVDLQRFSTILSLAYLRRTTPMDGGPFAEKWIGCAWEYFMGSPLCQRVREWTDVCAGKLRKCDVISARKMCAGVASDGVVWNAYGGHYLSPRQALQVDSLIATLPSRYIDEALSSIIIAVSKAVASPGHTAQPFQPTKTSLPYIRSAWALDIMKLTVEAFIMLSRNAARVAGDAYCGSAQDFAENHIQDNDVIFVDPPYSGVQYSRFYHVLETIANRKKVPVSGVGRYPSVAERPQSAFSNRGSASVAFENLIKSLSCKRITSIVTFPDYECSNGLSGAAVEKIASKYFRVTRVEVDSNFSTLGGNNSIRDARKRATELILILKN